MPLHVTGVRPARPPAIDTDPLKVSWFPVGSVGPVYCMLRADNGGLLEIKVEPLTGELVAVILVLGPPLTAPPLLVPDADEMILVEGNVQLDLAPWAPNPDGAATKSLVDQYGPLGLVETEEHVEIRLADDPVCQRVASGAADVGLSGDGRLISVRIAQAALPPFYQMRAGTPE